MPFFVYEGRNQAGEKVEGTLEAGSVDEAVKLLMSRHITPLHIEQEKRKGKKESFVNRLFIPKVKMEEILVFSRQMSVLVSAGVPVLKSIRQLSESAKSKALKKILSNVADGVAAGKSFAASLQAYSKVFSPIYVSLISVGENTGRLEDAFAETAKFLELSISNRKRLVATIRYPLFVLGAILAAMLTMGLFVIPKFAAVFGRYKVDLPLPTRILIASSNFVLNYWLWILLTIVAIGVAIRFILPFQRIRYLWDKYKLRVPIVGGLAKRIILSQFARSFSMVIRAGVPVLKGIDLVANVTGNLYITGEILKMRDSIDRGAGLSKAASEVDLFDAVALQMLEVGDTTGKIDDMLNNVASAYEGDLDYDIKRLTDVLEPVLLAGIGAMIVVLALAVYLPMWDLIKVVKI